MEFLAIFQKTGELGWDKTGHYFFNLVFVSLVRTGAVIGEGFGAGEFVVGGRGGDYVAVTGYLAGEAGDGTGYWADLGQLKEWSGEMGKGGGEPWYISLKTTTPGNLAWE